MASLTKKISRLTASFSTNLILTFNQRDEVFIIYRM